jgi:transketolase
VSEKKMVNPRNAYGQALIELGEKYKELVVLDADLSKSTKTIMFAKEFPDRFFEMGIAEANMISTAAGLASCEKIPFVSTFAVFATGRVYDQIRMDIAYSNANVKIFATHGGISVGKDGVSHQMIEDIALMRVLPNMSVIAPSDANQTKKIVHLMADEKGPMYARVGRANAPLIYEKEDISDIKIGKGITVKDGNDITFICTGTMVEPAIEAFKLLKKEKINVKVIDMHTIKPIDESLVLKCAKETNGIITAEEHSIIGGLGAAVAELIAEKNTKTRFLRMGIKDMFCESGSPEALWEKYQLNEKHMVENAKKMVNN